MVLLVVVHVQLCFYHIQLHITKVSRSSAVGTKVYSISCEMDGIVLRLELLFSSVKY